MLRLLDKLVYGAKTVFIGFARLRRKNKFRHVASHISVDKEVIDANG